MDGASTQEIRWRDRIRLPWASAFILSVALAGALEAREWKFSGVSQPYEAEFVGMRNGWVVLKDTNGKSFEFALDRLSRADQQYLRALSAAKRTPADLDPGRPLTSAKSYQVKKHETLLNQVVNLVGNTVVHVTGKGDPITGSTFVFNSPDAFLFLDQVPPSVVEAKFLGRMRVNRDKAEPGVNLRVAQYGSGSVVIPHAPDFPAMTLYDGKDLSGSPVVVSTYEKPTAASLIKSGKPAASFVLKRGYMATIAEKENGTGVSRNYVAQDHDIVVGRLPEGLDQGVAFVRVFPWRWVSKKGVAGGIWQGLNVGWFYDWNIDRKSTADLEYVPIRQNRHWPGLNQDWRVKGSTHLLGFNEPERPDQANMKVDEAISAWPLLLATGLRLGAPAPSDGGLGWLYEFMDKAKAANLRVDFVPVHYYRAVSNPGDAKGAADQFHRFLKDIHDRVKRPLWVTEWNNGANWTKAPKPTAAQQSDAVREMIRMLDETPFVERYAIYNWVEEARFIKRKDDSLTPAGVVYRDKVSPLSYIQAKPE